jgi:hypothetical protein
MMVPFIMKLKPWPDAEGFVVRDKDLSYFDDSK